jgi:hypothetical protein
MVVSVDEDKGYINLSKKRVASEDIPPKQDVFHKAKAAPMDSASRAVVAALLRLRGVRRARATFGRV